MLNSLVELSFIKYIPFLSGLINYSPEACSRFFSKLGLGKSEISLFTVMYLHSLHINSCGEDRCLPRFRNEGTVCL